MHAICTRLYIYISHLPEAFGFCACLECCRKRLRQCCNHEPPLSKPCQGNYASLILKINIKQCLSKIYLIETAECKYSLSLNPTSDYNIVHRVSGCIDLFTHLAYLCGMRHCFALENKSIILNYKKK